MPPDDHANHGQNLTATFAAGRPPCWPAARELLARHGFAAKMRMIDGQPAFPDEEPAEGWREIRLAAADGMVTVRRDGDRLAFVTWGNAGPAVLRAANALAWAFAEAAAGTIDAGKGPQSAVEFLQGAEMPDSWKMGADG